MFGTVTRDPAATRARSTDIAGTVVFQASDTTAPVPADATILDVADENSVSSSTTPAVREHVRRAACGSFRET